MANRGGAGGNLRTPESAIGEFVNFLREKDALFTQREFTSYCFTKWKDWIRTISDDGKFTREERLKGLRVRLERNFYPSFIDSLHVWSLLSEAKWFDTCLIDPVRDAYSKADLILIKDESLTKIALLGPFDAIRDRTYKRKNRGNRNDYESIYEFILPKDRPRSPGNKRWWKLSDFEIIRPIPRDGLQYCLAEVYYSVGA